MKVRYADALIDALNSGKELTPDEMAFLRLALPVTHPVNWEMVTWP